jgi:hypothetical protein
MCNDQSYRIVYMAKIVMLTTAFALLILVTNHMHVVFVTDNNKSDHDSILQNVFAQALQSKQKPSTSLVSEAIAPVLLAPIATSGNNVYLIWSSNKTGNYEIMFRASSDHGQSFENKINLSNSASDSQNPEVQSSGDRVFVTWWERNSTSNEPVLRISGDDGKTFGPTLKLSFNGPINNG